MMDFKDHGLPAFFLAMGLLLFFHFVDIRNKKDFNAGINEIISNGGVSNYLYGLEYATKEVEEVKPIKAIPFEAITNYYIDNGYRIEIYNSGFSIKIYAYKELNKTNN